jgi:hypothetical protein
MMPSGPREAGLVGIVLHRLEAPPCPSVLVQRAVLGLQESGHRSFTVIAAEMQRHREIQRPHASAAHLRWPPSDSARQ